MYRSLLLAVVLAAGASLAQQGNVLYQDLEQNLILKDFITHKLSFANDKVIFSGTGKPVHLESRSGGLLILGNSLSGEAKRDAKSKSYTIEKADVDGDAVLIRDSRKAQQFLIESKLLEKLTPTQSSFRLDSASFGYVGSLTAGTLTIPSKLRIRLNSEGTQEIVQADKSTKTKSFTRSVDLTGSSGLVTFYQLTEGQPLLVEGGRIQGPVQFVIKGSEQMQGEKEPTLTDVSGTADMLSFDFKSPKKTMTLSGNVHLIGTGATYSGQANANSLVVTLDDALQPISYDFDGSPAITKIKTGGGK